MRNYFFFTLLLFCFSLLGDSAHALVCRVTDDCYTIKSSCLSCVSLYSAPDTCELDQSAGCGITCPSIPLSSTGSPVACAPVVKCSLGPDEYDVGQVVMGYLNPAPPVGSCAAQQVSRKCLPSGQWDGIIFPNCAPAGPAVCIVGGTTVPDGQPFTGYTRPMELPSVPCTKITLTCVAPNFPGLIYEKCDPMGGGTCLFGSQTIQNGDSVNGYRSPNPPCEPISPTCNNGTWSEKPYRLCPSNMVPVNTPCNVPGKLQWKATTQTLEGCDGMYWRKLGESGGPSSSCTGAGKIKFFSDDANYCNGTEWVRMKGGPAGSCTSSENGKFKFDAVGKYFKYCTGSQWRKFEVSGTPDPD